MTRLPDGARNAEVRCGSPIRRCFASVCPRVDAVLPEAADLA